MLRRIIEINEDKCNGCGICAAACHEGAIGMIDGKAKLLRDDYCDGLGDCLPTCPTGAISFTTREAVATALTNASATTIITSSELSQWPVQIKLAPVKAPYFDNARLLIAADCTAYAYGSFHQDFIKGRITLIGCPKLDAAEYSEKLTDIIRENNIHDVTVVRMEVPCCGGIEQACITALKNSKKFLPWQVVTISTDGKIL